MSAASVFSAFVFFLFALSGGALAVPPSSSPVDTPARAAPPAGNSATRVSTAELHRFAAAYREVSRIRKKLMIETYNLSDTEKIAALKAQAEGEMKAAILRHLTLGEYVRIGKAINADPVLHARFMQIRKSVREAPPAASVG